MYHLYLVIYVIAYFYTQSLAENNTTRVSITSIFEGLGYSPSCVAQALASCEHSTNTGNMVNASEVRELPSSHQTSAKQIVARNCEDHFAMGDTVSGVRIIYPYDCCRERKVTVFCDQETDGGGWTVIQNRDALPAREDFYRTWVEYVLGFGNVTGEYWLGLDNIHALVSSNLMELRVDLVDYDDVKRWAKHGVFYVGDSATKYQLSVGRYSGDATDHLTYNNGIRFSTHDQDNDSWNLNCAEKFRGGWWYRSCHYVNLNGFPYVGNYKAYSDGEGIVWRGFRGINYSLKKTSMKIRMVYRS